ncbi:hypothetical protein BC826DRAFT_1104549 [Russula brevipes]|nr:hypothetical protein BC826DRAFT_1104549 [Russula brevipes]
MRAGVAVLPLHLRLQSGEHLALLFLSVLSIDAFNKSLTIFRTITVLASQMVTLDHRNAVSSVRRSAFIDRILLNTLSRSGIGQSAAHLFTKEGAKLVPRRKRRRRGVVDEIKAAGGDAIAVVGDVAADDIPAKILDAVIKQLNHIINNGASAAFVFSSLARCTVTTGGFTNDRMRHHYESMSARHSVSPA